MKVLRGARVVDGTGAAEQQVDVAIDGQEVVAMGNLSAGLIAGADVIDLDGLVLAPGFIDPHTHYDAQVLWDPDLTPSCWHGVTTVVMGNCGIGVAPTRPEHREAIIDTLTSVEGMAPEALRAGISWTFETFGEYLDAIEAAPIRLNVTAMIAHNPLRLYAMGDEALERAASAEEIGAMRSLVSEALAAGACGFSTSRATSHSTVDGGPVPSRVADRTELDALFGAVGAAGHGMIEVAVGPDLGFDELPEIAARTGRPVTSTGLVTAVSLGRASAVIEQIASAGGNAWPQLACRPIVMQVNLAEPFPLAMLPSFKEVIALPLERRSYLYADSAWRDRARPEVAEAFQIQWEKITIEETRRHSEIRNGPSIEALSRDRGVDPFDLFLDLAIEEELETRFRLVLANDDEDQLAALLRDPRVLLGLSDAGAHMSQLCDACYSTYLLQHWVRETGTLELEQAIWRLTGHPAGILGIHDRGKIAPGFAADLVAFDPATVGAQQIQRVWDLPSGADRLVAGSTGVEAVWVNGTAIRKDGVDVGNARPGSLLRTK